ncbi:hypothetical protein WNZ14_17695 [Hoeflea sp. AS60]|uniref:hypothetical protein n=1 Tax=Hoeflea sp. AS60 TaxID=3135780 RepID=UPI00316E4769
MYPTENQNYEIQQREGGWAYLIDGRRSPTYATRAAATEAAKGETKPVTFDQELDDDLEEGLEDSFPASDPVSVTRSSHTGGPDRSNAPDLKPLPKTGKPV